MAIEDSFLDALMDSATFTTSKFCFNHLPVFNIEYSLYSINRLITISTVKIYDFEVKTVFIFCDWHMNLAIKLLNFHAS